MPIAANSVPLVFDATIAADLAVAALAGMAVGIERERSGHASGPQARFAGVRTFFLIGTLGGLAGWLLRSEVVGLGIVLLAAGASLTVAAYLMAARPGGEAVEGTTEMAALVVLGLGAVAGLGLPLVTSAIASIMVLVLVEKTRIHDAIKRLGERELAAALQFAVLALVVLPLVPTGPYGPFDSVRPRALWTVVLLFSALNFAGYVLCRALGGRRGYGLSGLLGGLISSTAVTIQFSRRSREMPAAQWALALGVVGACTVLIIRVTLVAAVLHAPLAWALIPYLLPVLLIGVAVLGLTYRHPAAEPSESFEDTGSPLGLWAALKMAVAFQLVLLVIPLIQRQLGPTGVLASAAVLGLTDMDALTYAMARLSSGSGTPILAARGIVVGIVSNTALKLTVALMVGRGDFRRVAGAGLAALGIGGVIGFWLMR